MPRFVWAAVVLSGVVLLGCERESPERMSSTAGPESPVTAIDEGNGVPVTVTPTGDGAPMIDPSPTSSVEGTPVVRPSPESLVEGSSMGAVLRILQPAAGDTVTLPAAIHYEVTGFEVGALSGGHMHAFVVGIENGFWADIPLERQSGVAVLPDNKLLTGKRDVTFQLARSDHTLLPDPEASVIVENLIMEGGR